VDPVAYRDLKETGIEHALGLIWRLFQMVVMETGYGYPTTGPPNGIASGEPDLLESGHQKYNTEPERRSQESFAEFVAKSNPPVSKSSLVSRRADRHYSKRMRRRLVYKNGEVNITQANIRKRRRRYLADIFTTLVDIQWRYNLLVFTLAFTFSWLIFALIWWLICFSHGDLDEENLADKDWKPCVVEIKSFVSAILFSIETQHTIGYGSRHTTEECTEAIILMMLQSCFGVICQAMMTGIVFAKLSRPKKRAETLMFSKNACICKQDGEMCLLFRVGDMRKSHIVEAHIRGVVIKKKITKEGEVLPLYQFDVDLGFNEGQDRLFLVWPVIIVHKITESSPFWEMSPEDLHKEQFEFIVILEGIVESTGMTTQARSSYLPGEILWGHRFERLVTFQKENGQYQIDYSRFNNTIPVDTPQCSARELSEMCGNITDVDRDSNNEEDSTHNSAKPFTNSYMYKRNNIAQTEFEYDNDFDSLDSNYLPNNEDSETLL
jgi:potassium inwardly-rectifying channel subfamily J